MNHFPAVRSNFVLIIPAINTELFIYLKAMKRYHADFLKRGWIIWTSQTLITHFWKLTQVYVEMPRLTLAQRCRIIGMLELNVSISYLSRRFDCSRKTIRGLKNRFNATGDVAIDLDQEDNEFLLSEERGSCYGLLSKTDGGLGLSMASILRPVPKQFFVFCLVMD